ncbi:MAG: hypothetical protein D6820_08640, partial [Lentisphaerae bacterium]
MRYSVQALFHVRRYLRPTVAGFIIALLCPVPGFTRDTTEVSAESQWICQQIVAGVHDYLVRNGIEAGDEATPRLLREKDGWILQLGPKRRTWLRHIWDENAYAGLWGNVPEPAIRQAMTRLPAMDLQDLLNITEYEIAKQALELGQILRKDPFNQRAHERVALLYALLAVREHAGRFYHPLQELIRAAVHLSLSRICAARQKSGIGIEGQLASILVESVGGRPAEGADRIEKLSQTEPDLSRVWQQLLNYQNGGDWRQRPKDAPLLVKAAWTQALLRATRGNASLEITEGLRHQKDGLNERLIWHRLLLEDPPTRKYLLPDLQKFIYQEGIAFAVLWKLYFQTDLAGNGLVPAMNMTDLHFFRSNGERYEFEPMPWGIWARRFQRHLCHLLVYVLGLQMTDRKFYYLRY